MAFKPNPRLLITFGVVFSWYAHSCQTNNPHSQQSFDIAGETNLATQKSEAIKQNELKLTLAHPKVADAWHTRKLIMMYPQPAPARILECKETVESVSANSKNLRDMDEASLSLGSKIQQNKAQYHWCFYQLMTDLDLKLERDASLLQEKSDVFLSRMRTLWVIAKALDAAETQSQAAYNKYLRKRYMDISQHHFGRPVEVIDPDALARTAGKSGKAAADFRDVD